MGADDLLGGGLDINDARYNHNNRTQQADFPPGQDFGADLNFDQNFDSFPGGSFDSLGGNINNLGFNTTPQQTQQTQQAPKKAPEDIAWDVAKVGWKGFSAFSKELYHSLKITTPKFWAVWGVKTMTVSGVVSVVGLVLLLFGQRSLGFDLIIGGILGITVGVVTLLFNTEQARLNDSMYQDEESQQPTEQTQDYFSEEPLLNTTLPDESYEDYDEDDDDIYETGGFIEDDDDDLLDYSTPIVPPKSTEDALAELPDISPHTYTRQYLYDMFTKVLTNEEPRFYEVREIDESSDTFVAWSDYLHQACVVSGIRDTVEPYLISMSEDLTKIVLKLSRDSKYDADAIATELSNIYAYSSLKNKNGRKKKNENVFAITESYGTTCLITVYTGVKRIISLKDMYGSCKEFILDPNIMMPVVFGIDETGEVIHADMKLMESVIVTGLPRKGKSWLVQNIATQMAVYASPTELNFYIFDPKAGISDYKAFCLPHVKKFVTNDADILATLRYLVKVEGERRRTLIGGDTSSGFSPVNIWDFKDINPDVELPVIYIIIDEVVTLASRMDKDTNAEFRLLLRELISQMPALGIRAILLPHILNDTIIEKKTSDLVSLKVSVCGTPDHIEKATNTKPKDFKFKLPNKGDTAMLIQDINPKAMYIKSPVLSTSNVANAKLFIYLRKVWKKLEPDAYNTDYMRKFEDADYNKKLLEEFNARDKEDYNEDVKNEEVPISEADHWISSDNFNLF